jgi:hypothetical protein
VQLTPEVVDSPTLAPAGKKNIQQVVGALMYYARAVDPTLMTDISSLASQKSIATEDTDAKLVQLLNYCATHPNAKLRYHASDMILNIHSNAGYLNTPKARSRAGGHLFMSSKPKKGEQQHHASDMILNIHSKAGYLNTPKARIRAGGHLFMSSKTKKGEQQHHASDMILNIHSNAGYLNTPKARSRAGGHLFMSSKPKKGEQQHNRPLLTFSTILRSVVTSAAEAEIGALFLNAKEGVNIRNILHEMGHPQPATNMQTDNTTAPGILRATCKQQRSKTMDM